MAENGQNKRIGENLSKIGFYMGEHKGIGMGGYGTVIYGKKDSLTSEQSKRDGKVKREGKEDKLGKGAKRRKS